MKKFWSILAASVLVLGTAGFAGAAQLITAADIPAGNPTSVTLGSYATISSSSGGLDTKTVAGWTGIGVHGGVDGEIDVIGGKEFVSIGYAQPQVIDYITIGFLFKTGNYGDKVNEAAVFGPSGLLGLLTVVDGYNATWTGIGTVTNLSPGLDNYAGIWRIDHPFGVNVQGLTFSAGAYPGAQDGTNSDFSIVAVKTPEPLSMILTGLGLLGLAVLRRKD